MLFGEDGFYFSEEYLEEVKESTLEESLKSAARAKRMGFSDKARAKRKLIKAKKERLHVKGYKGNYG